MQTAHQIAESFIAANGFRLDIETYPVGSQLLIVVYTRNHNPADEIARTAEECGGTYDGPGSGIN